MSLEPVMRYETEGGARIYRIPVQVFSNLVANVYLVIRDEYVALIDAGSGLGESDDHIRSGMEQIRDEWGELLDWSSLRRIVVTHAHIDHYGGLDAVREQSRAPIAVHELDWRALTHHEERFVLASRALSDFLWHAGVPEAHHVSLMGMYSWSKGLFQSVDVETVLHDGDLLDDILLVHHMPGHCPGQICLQIDDVLFSADHVLARTTPHMAPESIMPSTGLSHYLASLRAIAAVPNVRFALGGHEDPIYNLPARIAQIEASHQRKLDRLLHACVEPRTINELAHAIYPDVASYDILLALEEIGAHVEYLDQHGALGVANISEIASDFHAAPQYCCL